MTSLLTTALSTLHSLCSSLLPATNPKRITLLVTGLDNSGKTTLLHRMRKPAHEPGSGSGSSHTLAFSPISTSLTDIKLTTTIGKHLVLNPIDLGGFCYRDHPGGIQQLWRDYLYAGDVDGIVLVVDAADWGRLDKAGTLLRDLLGVLGEFEREGPEASKPIPVLVLGNKIDAFGAVSEEELRRVMGVPIWGENKRGRSRRDAEGKGEGEGEVTRPVELFMCTVVMGQGYQEGFEWLAGSLESELL
jgi:GTP-binding protein SAR1